MKLLYYNEEFLSKDGSRRHADNLCNALRRTDKLESVITFPKQLSLDNGIGTKKTISKGGFIISLARFVKRIISSIVVAIRIGINRREFDVVLARLATFDWTPLLMKLFYNKKYVLEWNTPYFYECGVIRKYSNIWLIRCWERIMIRYASRIYTVSEECAKMLADEYGISLKKFLVIPNGFEQTQAIKDLSNEHRMKIREILGFRDKFIITFAGSLKIWHGIEMIQRLANHYKDNRNILFVVIGDGEGRKLLTESENLKVLGALPYERMQEYLVASDLGIMPYGNMANFYFSPLKMYDMIGAALPSLAPPIGQIRECFEANPDCGFFCGTFDEEGYIKLIDNIVADKSVLEHKHNSLINERFGYSWDKRANALVDELSIIK